MMALLRRRTMQLPTTALIDPGTQPHAADRAALKQAAPAYGLRLGAAPEVDLRVAPAAYLQLLASQCELLAPILPWSATPRLGEYQFADALATAEFVRANRMQLTGSH